MPPAEVHAWLAFRALRAETRTLPFPPVARRAPARVRNKDFGRQSVYQDRDAIPVNGHSLGTLQVHSCPRDAAQFPTEVHRSSNAWASNVLAAERTVRPQYE